MINVKHNDAIGTTCGQRKDGSRAVLWADSTITWHSADEFGHMLWISEASVLAEGV